MANRFTIEQAMQKLCASADSTYGIVLVHGSLELGYYRPDGVDHQEPHDRDEVYVVRSGSGFFVVNDERQPVEAGDALFVPAFAVHRFEDFTDDFAAWVMFYGPAGSE